jgi:hypothetical protein
VVTLCTCVVPAVVVLWPGLVPRHMLPASGLALVGGASGWLLGLAIARHPLLGEIKRVVSGMSARYNILRG